MMKKALYVLTAALIFSSCTSAPNESGSPTLSGLAGSLTIDGKTEKLGHVFARRIECNLKGGDEAIVVLLSNKPLPITELIILLKDFSLGEKERDFFKDSSIYGLFFVIEKEKPFKENLVSFDRFIIRAGRLHQTDIMVGEFLEDFSLKQGRISARSKQDPEDVSQDEPQSDLKYSYTASFEADLQGRSVCEAFEGSPSADEGAVFSEPGTAEGVVVVSGKKIKLEYAYARRKKVFFDEPDELIEVVITGRPYQGEEIATILGMNAVYKTAPGNRFSVF